MALTWFSIPVILIGIGKDYTLIGQTVISIIIMFYTISSGVIMFNKQPNQEYDRFDWLINKLLGE